MAADQKDAAHVTYSVTHGPTLPRSYAWRHKAVLETQVPVEKEREARDENTTPTNYTEIKKNIFTHRHLSNKRTHKINWAQLS